MKRSPMFRIVLWSAVIFVLVIALCGFLFGPTSSIRSETVGSLKLEEVMPGTTPPIARGVTPGQVTVYASPSEDAQVVAVLEAETTVAITEQKEINGVQWDAIDSPYVGWIRGSQMIRASVQTGGLDAVSVSVIAENVNCYASHNTDSAVVGTLYEGDPVILARISTYGANDSEEWGYLTAPMEGWIQMTAVQVLETLPSTAPTAIVTENTNVRSAPNDTASAVDMLKAGREITIARRETVGGSEWAYITSPITGWVNMDFVSETSTEETTPYTIDSAAIAETTVTMVPAEPVGDPSIQISPSDVREIEIEWAAGDILIQPRQDIDYITFTEDGVTEEKYRMVWKVKERTLTIEHSNEDLFGFGIHFGDAIKKDLTIYVPWDWQCNSLEIDAASANLNVRDLVIREVEFDGASGICEFENCIVDSMDIDTASGDVSIVGQLEILDCDAASANIQAVLENVPNRLNVDSMSGDLDITLPHGAGFTLTMDAMQSDFTSDFATTMKNGSYVAGDGACRINMDGMSGNVTIRQAEPEAAANPIP